MTFLFADSDARSVKKCLVIVSVALAGCATPFTLAGGGTASVLDLNVCYSRGRAGDDNTRPYFQRPDGALVFASLKNLGNAQPGNDCDVMARFDQGFVRGVRSGRELYTFRKNAGSDTFDEVARGLYLALREDQDRLLAERAPWPPPQPARAQPAPQPEQVQPAPAPVHATVRASRASSVLAVLELRNKLAPAERGLVDAAYFSDQVRAAALKSTPGLPVITRENLLVLLQATGKDIANCEGECEVDTGRRIGADLVISGEVLKVGSNYKLNLKIHNTRSGRLLDVSCCRLACFGALFTVALGSNERRARGSSKFRWRVWPRPDKA